MNLIRFIKEKSINIIFSITLLLVINIYLLTPLQRTEMYPNQTPCPAIPAPRPGRAASALAADGYARSAGSGARGTGPW